MLILGIDTSGKNASVAICSENQMLAQYFVSTNHTHSQVILPLCQKMLDDLGVQLKDVDRFAVAAGPGSYTGLRIGIAAVKAMAFGLEKGCSGISTLEAIAYNFAGTADCIICSVMKARLDIVYCAVFKVENGKIIRCTEDAMMTKKELSEILSEYKGKIIAAGDAAEDFINETDVEKISLAPATLRYQLASGICMSALDKPEQLPDEIDAFYMQITKAEKDLIEKNNC